MTNTPIQSASVQHTDDIDAEHEGDDPVGQEDETVDGGDDDVHEVDETELDAGSRIRLALQQLQDLQEAGNDQSEDFFKVQAKLAKALFDGGRHEQALGCQRKLLTQISLPRDSEFVCEGHTTLALMLGEVGQHAEALKILKENAKLYEKSGEGLPTVLIQALTWNLSVLGGEKNLDSAYDILTQALKDDEGLSDADKHNLRVILANVLNTTGDHTKEAELRQTILDNSRARYGEGSQIVKDNEKQLAAAKLSVLQERRMRGIFKLVLIVGMVLVAWYYAQ